MTGPYPQQKIEVRLSGTDSNIFALMAVVSRAMKRAGQHEEAKAMCAEVTEQRSYDEALQTIMKYADIY